MAVAIDHKGFALLVLDQTAGSLHPLEFAEKLLDIWFNHRVEYNNRVGGLVENERGETLMIYCYRHWDLPKGHIDPGEKADETAVREVAEETGVAGAKIVRFLCNTMHAYGVYGVWELKQTSWYLCSAESCPTKPQQEEDIATAKWCSAEEVEENLRHSYPTIQNVFATRKAIKNE